MRPSHHAHEFNLLPCRGDHAGIVQVGRHDDDVTFDRAQGQHRCFGRVVRVHHVRQLADDRVTVQRRDVRLFARALDVREAALRWLTYVPTVFTHSRGAAFGCATAREPFTGPRAPEHDDQRAQPLPVQGLRPRAARRLDLVCCSSEIRLGAGGRSLRVSSRRVLLAARSGCAPQTARYAVRNRSRCGAAARRRNRGAQSQQRQARPKR
jgi:hypothetical protein